MTESSASAADYTTDMFQFEAAFERDTVHSFMNRIRHVSTISSIVYVVLLFAGRRYMTSREPFDLRKSLVAWNIVLAAFSIFGATRTVPELIHGIVHNSWTHSICDPSFYGGPTGFWALAFTLSKLVELGDTAFIVLRKQPLQFLHWYHHITVMMYCFYSYPLNVASGRWYMVMNYCVHSTMYTYYTFKAMRFYVPRQVSLLVTSLQILQMFCGLGVAFAVAVVKATDGYRVNNGECHQSYGNVGVTLAMYVSYLVLFVRFFSRAYAAPTRSGSGVKQTNGNKLPVENGRKKDE